MFVKINKNYLLVIFFLTLYLSNHRLSSIDSFHQFIRHQYFHLREAKPLLAQVLNGCTYVIYIIVYTKEAVMWQTECFNINRCILSIMTVYVELELTAYLLSVDDCRHVMISFIEQCQYSLVNIVVDKDNTFLALFTRVLMLSTLWAKALLFSFNNF